MKDETEEIRRNLVKEINAVPANRSELETIYGKVYDTAELQKEFTVKGFMAPFVAVSRISDGELGSLMFQHSPRYYFNFIKSE